MAKKSKNINSAVISSNNHISSLIPFNPNSYLGSGITSNQNSTLHVKGDANFEGDLKVNGVSLVETLHKIQDRLAILVPDPEKLEQFEALKKSYEQYKIIEALCGVSNKQGK